MQLIGFYLDSQDRGHRDLRDHSVIYLVAAFIATSVAFGVLFVAQLGVRPGGRPSARGARAGPLWRCGNATRKRRRLARNDKLRGRAPGVGREAPGEAARQRRDAPVPLAGGLHGPERRRALLGRSPHAVRRPRRRGPGVLPILGRGYLFSAIAGVCGSPRSAGSCRRSTSATGSTGARKRSCGRSRMRSTCWWSASRPDSPSTRRCSASPRRSST